LYKGVYVRLVSSNSLWYWYCHNSFSVNC